MEGYKKQLGEAGETAAARFLVRQGCRIIGRNYHTRWGEIDLIAESGDGLIFCEVKTRTSDEYGYPETAVDYYKVRKLLKTAGLYLQEKRLEKFWRLDIISVEINKEKKTAKIKWFKDVGV